MDPNSESKNSITRPTEGEESERGRKTESSAATDSTASSSDNQTNSSMFARVLKRIAEANPFNSAEHLEATNSHDAAEESTGKEITESPLTTTDISESDRSDNKTSSSMFHRVLNRIALENPTVMMPPPSHYSTTFSSICSSQVSSGFTTTASSGVDTSTQKGDTFDRVQKRIGAHHDSVPAVEPPEPKIMVMEEDFESGGKLQTQGQSTNELEQPRSTTHTLSMSELPQTPVKQEQEEQQESRQESPRKSSGVVLTDGNDEVWKNRPSLSPLAAPGSESQQQQFLFISTSVEKCTSRNSEDCITQASSFSDGPVSQASPQGQPQPQPDGHNSVTHVTTSPILTAAGDAVEPEPAMSPNAQTPEVSNAANEKAPTLQDACASEAEKNNSNLSSSDDKRDDDSVIRSPPSKKPRSSQTKPVKIIFKMPQASVPRRRSQRLREFMTAKALSATGTTEETRPTEVAHQSQVTQSTVQPIETVDAAVRANDADPAVHVLVAPASTSEYGHFVNKRRGTTSQTSHRSTNITTADATAGTSKRSTTHSSRRSTTVKAVSPSSSRISARAPRAKAKVTRKRRSPQQLAIASPQNWNHANLITWEEFQNSLETYPRLKLSLFSLKQLHKFLNEELEGMLNTLCQNAKRGYGMFDYWELEEELKKRELLDPAMGPYGLLLAFAQKLTPAQYRAAEGFFIPSAKQWNERNPEINE